MQDIRKPYTRSRSSNDLQSRVEQFEAARYKRDEYEDEPVQIPVRKQRRDIHDMDMYPRRSRDEELYEEEGFDEEEGPRLPPRRGDRPHGKKKSSLGTLIFIVTILLLVVGVSLYTYVFDSATITVVPKYKDVTDLDKTFVFSKEGADNSGVPFVIESTSLSKTKTLSLSESRKVEAKASGRAIIYNNYDSSPQKLIKNTRFESAKGKIYRINQSVEVPGKKGDTPGSIEVTLYADSNGADYNGEATTFTIPGFKGTVRESAFYAKSKGSITGGSSGTVSLASLSDLNAAKDALAVELRKSIEDDVKKINRVGYVPMYDTVDIVYEDNEDEILKGVTGIYQVKATAYIMLADGSKLAEAIAKTFGDYDDAPVRLASIEALTFTRKQTDRILGANTLSILVEGKPRVVWEINSDTIKDLVEGKKRDDFKPLMKTVNSIESAEISFSPMWLSRFPGDTSKLTVIESLPKR